MDYIKINGHFIVVSKLAVFSKGFNTIRIYNTPIAHRVSSINKKNGINEIKILLPEHKDNVPIVIPGKYIENIISATHYGDFEYKDFKEKFPIYEVLYEGSNDPLYVLVDKLNIRTYLSKDEVFKSLKNNLLQNFEIFDEL